MPNICFDRTQSQSHKELYSNAILFYRYVYPPYIISLKFEKGVILKFLRDIWPNTYRYKYGNTLII